MTSKLYVEKPYIQDSGRWKCPECNNINPPVRKIIVTNPPIACYKCEYCDYHYDFHGEYCY